MTLSGWVAATGLQRAGAVGRSAWGLLVKLGVLPASSGSLPERVQAVTLVMVFCSQQTGCGTGKGDSLTPAVSTRKVLISFCGSHSK